jgi:hypothetical protein
VQFIIVMVKMHGKILVFGDSWQLLQSLFLSEKSLVAAFASGNEAQSQIAAR